MEHLVLNFLQSAFHLEAVEFLQPSVLWLMLLWPLLILMKAVFRASNDDLSQRQSERQLLVKHALIDKMQVMHTQKGSSKWPFSAVKLGLELLRGLIIMSLVIAIAQPVQLKTSEPLPQQKTVRDVVFVIESSASFLLPDYQIDGQPETRMNVVKLVLDQFISGLEGNRFGLTIYAEKAYTLMPLTADQTAARLNLKRLKPYLAGRTDTAMGEALGLALKQTDPSVNKGTHPSSNKAASQTLNKAEESDQAPLKRVVVLISDGQSKPSRLALSEAINYAQMMQVPIYTIGVGANSEQADKRLYTGLLYQPLESQSLQTIALESHGQYYQVGSGADLSHVLQKINQAEGVPFTAPPRPPQQIALYYLPLTITLLSLMAYLLISVIFLGLLSSSAKPASPSEAA